MTARGPGEHCVTCRDDGISMRVVSTQPGCELALCEDADGERQTVDTGIVGPVRAGDSVLVHAGTALTVLEGAA